MGGMALALIPIASAQGLGNADIDTQTRAEIRAQLESCKTNNADNREAMKTCADAVFADNGIARPQRPEHQDIPEEARAELEACHESNTDDKTTMKACADAVFTSYGIEKPANPMMMKGKGRGIKMGHRFHTNINDTCGQRDDTDEWKACAKEQRANVRETMHDRKEARGGLFSSLDLRTELKNCLAIDDAEELRSCVFGVRAEARGNIEVSN